ncbi:TRAM domain-containing protein [Puniceicoccales bacterium CK1056]|uniref:TRAM domain-containing protein n=1 Tax=Oceanipulchritudo coccoides TaxID=2706888 RepID=A0A6B2M3R5_9BACT|nr:PIN domain-containing protein [Oceanipulchritudo coccoides]NDV62455.1 TRAM domain-containing protein [Oceanipulchritudo coccoides]
MAYTIRILRLFFILLCIAAGWLVSYSVPEWDEYRWVAVFIAAAMGALVVLVDVLLKGFSLRGLSALTFGLFVGWACAKLIAASPFFDVPFDALDEGSMILTQNKYLIQLSLYVILMYLGAVIALRGRDEFNLVIPYIRFVPHGVEVPLAIVDTSALIDGRLVGICESRFMGFGLVIPRFVIDELQNIADSKDPERQAKGRKGIEVLNQLREMEHLDLRINESSVSNRQRVDAKLVYLAQSLKAKLMTTDYNLAQIAEFHNIDWLNLNALAKAMNPQLLVGEELRIKLTKPGKDHNQAVGYLPDGSMVVVSEAKHLIGETVTASVDSIIPSAGGKMIFAVIKK